MEVFVRFSKPHAKVFYLNSRGRRLWVPAETVFRKFASILSCRLNNRQITTQKQLIILGSIQSMGGKILASHAPQAKEGLKPIPLRLCSACYLASYKLLSHLILINLAQCSLVQPAFWPLPFLSKGLRFLKVSITSHAIGMFVKNKINKIKKKPFRTAT
jgi:hypothetical protein